MNTRFSRILIILGIVLLVTTACDLGITIGSTPTPGPAATPDPNALSIAASPEMAPLLGKLADQFNSP